jgi:tRNA threonylcarbamoyladenosine biosynthesis protein TsaE
MEKESARFLAGLQPRADRATVVALSGDLGAGKTAFVKGVARALGLKEHVTSPTFVIMKIYDLEKAVFKRLVHIDAYRLKGEHHLKVLGWEELCANPQNLIMIEWPEQAASAIPAGAIRIQLRYSGEDEREIEYIETDKN